MSKLRIVDSDWDKIPADVEEIGGYENGDITYYKNIKENTYEYRTPRKPWASSRCTPFYEKRIKRPSNIFTKSMLVAGKHIVEVRHPYDGVNRYEILSLDNGTLILQGIGLGGGFLYLNHYEDSLTIDIDGDGFDIMKVFTREYPSRTQDLKLIWERTPTKVPTQKELQLAALQDTINKAQEQIEELMKD